MTEINDVKKTKNAEKQANFRARQVQKIADLTTENADLRGQIEALRSDLEKAQKRIETLKKKIKKNPAE